jgi:hypothetical protein
VEKPKNQLRQLIDLSATREIKLAGTVFSTFYFIFIFDSSVPRRFFLSRFNFSAVPEKSTKSRAQPIMDKKKKKKKEKKKKNCVAGTKARPARRRLATSTTARRHSRKC